MTRLLLATDSVHTTAAACDYLEGRVGPGDAVTVLTVAEPGADPRDGDDAINVATVRLSALATVETVAREGAPADSILEVAGEGAVDEIVVGVRSGEPGGEGGLGGTTAEVLGEADVPVVVLPLPRLG